MLNIHDIAQDVGVSDDMAKRWLAVLEKSDIIFYLRPYSNNLLKMNGAINGAILENYVVSEIIKSYHNCASGFFMPKNRKIDKTWTWININKADKKKWQITKSEAVGIVIRSLYKRYP